MVRKRIKDYINKYGISQRELADGVGMSPGSISMLLNGKLNMKVDRYLDICAYLGVDPAKFMRGLSTGRNIKKFKPKPEKEKGRRAKSKKVKPAPREEKTGATQPEEEKSVEGQNQPGKEKSSKGTAKGDEGARSEELGAGLAMKEVKEKEGSR